MFRARNYFEAAIEYERLLFSSSNRETGNYARFQKAMCYKNMGSYSRAVSELQSIYFATFSDTLFAHVAYQEAFCHYLNNDALNALWKIDEFINRTHDSVTYNNFIPLKVLCLNNQHEWDNARSELNYFIQNAPITNNEKEIFQNEVAKFYNEKTLPKIRSVKKAQNFSRFVPGLGQIYAGKFGEGTVNFLINASLLAFSAHQFYHQFYITGYFAGLGMFNKIYHGGIKRAGKLAAEKNKLETTKFNHQINALLIDINLP